MKKFKLSKEGSIRFVALTLSAVTLLTVFTGCTKKGETEVEDTKLVQKMDDYEECFEPKSNMVLGYPAHSCNGIFGGASLCDGNI